MSNLALLRMAGLSGWKRWTALILLVLVPLGAVLGLVGATAANAEDPPSKIFSFYGIASATTAFFSDVNAPDSDKSLGDDSPWLAVTQDAASSGSMLGWADPDFNVSLSWLTSSLSGTSDALGYDALKNAGTEFSGMLDYAHFGAAVNGLGLDSMSTGLSLGMFEWMGGGVVALLYLLSILVDSIFMGFLAILKLLNPFKLLYGGVAAINPAFAEGMVSGDTTVFGPLAGLATFVSDIYAAINAAAWGLMVPLFIGILLFGLLMFKKMNRGGAIKKLFIRIFFIGLGLPLLGMMYTGTIDSMAEASEAGNMGATQVVLSTYVDFESWATNQRLAVPANATIEWNVGRNQPSADATMSVRETALAINALSQPVWSNVGPVLGGDNSIDWSSSVTSSSEGSFSGGAYVAVLDLLTRYMTGAKVEAATFENDAKGVITGSNVGDDLAASWFKSIREGDIQNPSPAPGDNPVLSVAPGTGLTASGSIGVGDDADGVDYFSNVKRFTTEGVSTSCKAKVSTAEGAPLACNLSPLAMYNYLNTSFGSESMTTYSSQKVMSGATRESHNSVTQVGTGAMGFLYWFNSVVLLGAFVTIGIGYAVSMLIGNIRRGFQTITAVPFATLGAIAGIAKVLVYTFAMILEVVVTLFLYKLVQEFLVAVPKIIEYPFSLIMNGSGGLDENSGFVLFLTSGGALTIVVTLLSIIGVIVFTVMAMRVRKSLLKAIEEAVTKLVEKFTDASVGMPGGGKMAPAIAGGIGAGAGAAAASRMMSNGSSRGPKGAALPGGDGSAPDAVSVGGTSASGDGGGSQPGGAGGASSVDGEIETGDGTLAIEGGADAPGGNGDPGTQAELGAGSDGANAESAAGRQVEANGLTPVESSGSDGIAAGGTSSHTGPQADAGDAMADSLDRSAEGYKAADKQRLGAGKDGAEAVGHGAIAVGRGFAGDAAGAAESGGRAVEKGGSAAAAGERAKQTEQDAGRSSLDKPTQKHAQRAQQAEQVSQLGGTVANAAGAASSTGGASKGAAAAKGASATASAPKGASSAPRPQQAPQRAQQGTAQPERAPQVQRPQAPRQQPVQPRPQVARPAAQPSAQPAPRPNVVQRTSVVNNATDRRSKVVNKAVKKKPITPSKGKPKGVKGA